MFIQASHISILLIACVQVSSTLEWRIFDGQDLRLDVHSYLVQLKLYRYNISSVGTCSGSIISSSWIMTSSHCIQPNLHTVFVQHNTKYNKRIISVVDISDVYCHPEFIQKMDTLLNREKDIALLYIREHIEFDSYIQPIKLSTIRPKIGDSGIIAGYGETEINFKSPREGIVVIDTCPNKSNVICTRGSVRAGAGDSGGPLIYKGKLAGLTSGGCLDVHTNNMCLTVYTSVTGNMEWILGVINSIN